MNFNYINEQVFNAVNNAGDNFIKNLIGSIHWPIKENKTISETYCESGIIIKTQIKNPLKPDGQPILPQDAIDPEWLNLGSYFGQSTVKIPNEKVFEIHSPHNKQENQTHFQKGKEKIEILPNIEKINNYGAIGSGLTLKFIPKDEAIDSIQRIREV